MNTGVMAPSHELRQEINGHIRERLAREGRIHGPAMAERTPGLEAATPTPKRRSPATTRSGDVVAFHRPYKRIGVEKGDERRVKGVNHKAREVVLEGKDGGTVAWKPGEIGGRRGGSEVYRTGRTSSCVLATASAGPATMPAWGWSIAARPRFYRWLDAAG